MSFPKILIFGQPFNNFSGGGITLTNLFKGWPKDKIAVAFIGHGLFNVTTDVCDTYYQLGEEEHKWVFPFNLIQRKFPSGLKSFDSKVVLPINFIQTGIRYKIVNQVFYPFLRWLGLFHLLSRISLSDKFKSWLSVFHPDVLYLQVSTREGLLFAQELNDFLKIPSVIHVMDDWPSTISNKGLLKYYWHKKIDNEFRQLLDHLDLYMSISDRMSDEYKKRYNKKFIPFHNPIEIEHWLPSGKSDFAIDKNQVTILYSGRIGDLGIIDSLVEFASAIDFMNSEEVTIRLHIQTPTKKKDILELLQKFNCVVINPFVEYGQLPDIFSKADILLLANDFSSQGVDYLKLSMPTKASEYMISGTPVLVYAAEETAVSKFFSQNECGYCVTSQGTQEIIKAIQFMIDNREFRQQISKNAVLIAREKFDAFKVRNEFQGLLESLKK